MEDRSDIVFTTNKSWMENMAYGGHVYKQVNIHSVDLRISLTHSSS